MRRCQLENALRRAIISRSGCPQSRAHGYAWGDIVRANKILQLVALAAFWTLSPVQSHAQDAWGALTACCVGSVGSPCPGDGVSTGYGSGPTQEAAISGALNDALSDVNSSYPWKCNTVRTFNRGCAYIAEGCNDQTNRCSWATGGSEVEALGNLRAQGITDASAYGGCVGQ